MNDKYYVVTSEAGLNSESLFHYITESNITRNFQRRKAAENYGIRLAEKYGSYEIHTFEGTKKISTENY